VFADESGSTAVSEAIGMFKHLNTTIMRIVLPVYWAYLSVLLLSRDPTRWIGTPGHLPEFLRVLLPFAHMLSFSVCTVIALAACLPLPRWSIILSLVVYGALTEFIQGFVPCRTPEWVDWLQDLAGIAIGLAGFWFAIFVVRLAKKTDPLEVPYSS
jgi:VanZ family protein